MTTKIKIGQIWQRKDGRKVRIKHECKRPGWTEYELVPLDGGRRSWKMESRILSELTLVSEK